MEKEPNEKIVEKIMEASVPYSDISGWVNAFREHGLSDVEMTQMLKKLNVTNYQERKKSGLSDAAILAEESEAWRSALIDGGFSKEEAGQIVERLAPAEITPAREIPIQYQEGEKGVEIPVKI